MISIEYKPNEPRAYSLLANLGTTLLAIKEINLNNIGVTIDFAHILYSNEQPALVAALIDKHSKILGLHLNDGYGKRDDGLMVGSVHQLATIELLYHISKSKYNGPIYFDTFPDTTNMDPVKECELNISTVKQQFKLVDKLIKNNELSNAIENQDSIASHKILIVFYIHKMKSDSIVVLGSLHYDIYIQSNSIPKIGETVLADNWFPKLGGKGANQAVALRKEFKNVKFISAIGDDIFSKFLLKKLNEHKVSADYISKIKGDSGVSVAISNEAGDYSAVVVSGVNTKIPEKFLCDSKLWEGVSSLMIQNEISEEINALAAKEAKKRSITVLLNAAPAKKIENLIKFVDILLVNEIEAQQISNDYSNSFDSIAKKLSKKI